MAKGIIYLMSTIVDGLVKIGKTDNFENRMRELENNGYRNITGLKREFAIEVENYDEKERLLHSIFSKSRLSDTELFSVDIDLVKQLLSAFEGKIIYPKEARQDIFIKAAEASERKEEAMLERNRHHFKDVIFTSSLTGKQYKGTTSDAGVLSIIDLETGAEIQNNAKPNKKAIIGKAVEDLGGSVEKDETTYQRYRSLCKLINNND